ncbi:glycosyltransferase [Bordetella sp. BOR01]|uniref:glycosyltransferase n=1 Tax=Bordetella sp. BOR01 TaxID=2854779 RepID=UPI001C44A606|nr:glycosyltransferase [Bordetella sp. BOR01]MBV7486195.1 glycosyltransferase [Bordetella sp. BOR01]
MTNRQLPPSSSATSKKAGGKPAATAPRAAQPATAAGKLLKQQRMPVIPAKAYRVCITLLDREDRVNEKAVLLNLRFLDAAGQVVATPIPHWTFSKRYEQWAAYLPSAANASQKSESRPFVPPPEACHVDISLLQWQGSDSVTIDGEVVLHAERESLESLQAHERRSPQAASLACGDALDEGTEDLSLLQYILAFARRHGNASLLRRSAAALLALDSRQIDRQAILLWLDELRELDPYWLPLAAGSDSGAPAAQKRPNARQPHRVAHLCGDSADGGEDGLECIAHIATQHAPDGVQPILLTPAEYLQEKPSHGPWKKAERSGIPWFQLDSLSTSAQEKIERTRIMELDVILGTHVCRQNQISVIHAHAGRRGHDLALRGLAIAHHLRIPTVYEIRQPFGLYADEPGWHTGSELVALRHEQQLRCMHLATAVITISDAMKTRLVAQGVADDKIFVVPETVHTPDPTPARAPLTQDSNTRRIGIVAESVPATLLPALLDGLGAADKMHLAIYGNNQRLDLWRTIAAQYPGLDIAYVDSRQHSSTEAREFLRSQQCLVLPETSECWTEQRLTMWALNAMASGVPIIETSDSGMFCGLIWNDKKIVLTADWSALPKLLHRIEAGTVPVKAMVKRAHDWARATRSPATAARHYEAVYDHARKQVRSRATASTKRAATASR